MLQMVGRQCAEPGGQRRAPRFESCSAWSFTGSPWASAASNTRRVWSSVNPMPSQKASTASARARLRDGGDHLAADQVDIAVGIARIFGRQGVGAQEGRADVDAAFAGEGPGGAQALELVRQGQAVAGLHLDCGHALRQQGV
jgi:hypothetical protein